MMEPTDSGKAGDMMADRFRRLKALHSLEPLTCASSINPDERYHAKVSRRSGVRFLQDRLIAVQQVHPQMICGSSLSAPWGDFQAGRALGFAPRRK